MNSPNELSKREQYALQAMKAIVISLGIATIDTIGDDAEDNPTAIARASVRLADTLSIALEYPRLPGADEEESE